MNEKGRGVHSRLLFGIDIRIGNGWYGCPSHSPKRQGGHQGKGLASMRWHQVVIVNGWQGLGIMPAWFTCCLSVRVRELPIKKGMIKTIIPS